MIRLGLAESLYEAPREKRALNPRDAVFAEWAAETTSGAGVSVTQESARSLSAYWNGVCVISGDLGVMDRHLYRRVGDDDRERATSHPAYKLIHDQPNPDTTPMVFWETFSSHAVSWGNGYAEIEWDNALRPIGLHIITPNLIEPKLETIRDNRGRTYQRVYYLYRDSKRIAAEDILHVPGLGFDGVRGYSPVYLARQSLGLSLAMEQFGASFYGNGAWPGIALEAPTELKPAARANLRESIEAMHRGPGRAHRMIILEEGLKVSKPITVPPEDAQFLEGRQFSVEEIARWLNLPPHKLKHRMGDRPGGNLESSEIDYQVTTLLPWMTRIQQEVNRKLIAPAQRGTLYAEHNFAARFRADTETRMDAYRQLFDMKVMDSEQIARAENLPKPKPAPAPEPAPAPAAPPTGPAPAQPVRSTSRLESAQRALLLSVVNRFMRREAEQARRAADRGGDAFGKWLETRGPGEEAVLVESLEPAVAVCVASRGVDLEPVVVAGGFAARYLARSREEMEALPQRTVGTAIHGLLKRWESTRGLELVEELIAACQAAMEREHVA